MPAVPLICAVFPEMEKKVAFEKGMPNLRIAFLPYHHEIYLGATASEYRKILEGTDPVNGKPVLEEIVDALTRPLSLEESKSGMLERPVPRSLDPDTPENLQRYFMEKGWTDYLPIVLPTEDKVKEMLKGTSRKPGEIVGKMAPSTPHEAWDYTVEKVAVNAVMAGARPEHFPIILAQLQPADFPVVLNQFANPDVGC